MKSATQTPPETTVGTLRFLSFKFAEPLFCAAVSAAILLGVLLPARYLFERKGAVAAQATWSATTNSFLVLATLGIAFLALGRYHVLRDSTSYWIGMGFAGFGLGSFYYTLCFPGLLPDGGSLLARLPSTPAWIIGFLLSLLGGALLASVLMRWPGNQALAGQRWLWVLALCLGLVSSICVVIIAFEQHLPPLVTRSGVFTPLFLVWQCGLLLTFVAGAFLSTRRYLVSDDALFGYITLAQVTFVLALVAALMGRQRYNFWWFLGRAIAAGGGVAVMFGLLNEYLRLYNERNRAEAALRESETKFRAIVENSHEAIIFLDGRGTIFYRSPSSRLTNGYALEERLGHDGFELVHPDDLPAVRRAWAELLEHPETLHEVNYRLRHKDGTWRWLEASAQNLLGNPNVRAVVATIRDITDHKLGEEALAASETRYRTLFEAANDAVFLHGVKPDGSPDTFIAVNEVAVQRFGFSAEEFAALTPADIDAGGFGEERRRAMEAIRDEGHVTFEMVHVAKDGRHIPVEISSRKCAIGDRILILSIARDLSERKRAEEEKANLQNQLLLAQKLESIGQLAGGVAHDFNNLLQVINGYSDLLLRKLKKNDPVREEVAEIRRAGEQGAVLTKQLLTFSREQLIEPEQVDLNAVIQESQPMLQKLAGEDIEVETDLSSAGAFVLSDPVRLQQLLMNLAANSRDAMPLGGEFTIRTAHVNIGENETAGSLRLTPGQFVLLQVSDTGAGIPKEIQGRIFDPFFTTKGSKKGTGLGLATVYGIVRLSGGAISVRSEPGCGATFDILLPRIEKPVLPPVAAVSLPEAARGTETVLVVEDRPEVRCLVVETLRASGYAVLEAGEGSEALAVAERHSGAIHLLLTDVIMPRMTGKELAWRLAHLRPEMKVLYMSGYAADVISSRGLLNSGESYIAKPFSMDALLAKVREILGPASSATIR